MVVWRVFLKAVTVAMVPLALMSTRTFHALETSSTPKSLIPDLVRHLKVLGRMTKISGKLQHFKRKNQAFWGVWQDKKDILLTILMQINKYLKFEKNCPLTLMDQKMMFFGKKQVMEAKKNIYRE